MLAGLESFQLLLQLDSLAGDVRGIQSLLQQRDAELAAARQQEAATIRAQGLKQAQLVRADADAEAASTYAKSFGKDPEFYAFYRAMQAYRTTFNDQSSTVIMSPNNEFLREFEPDFFFDDQTRHCESAATAAPTRQSQK